MLGGTRRFFLYDSVMLSALSASMAMTLSRTSSLIWAIRSVTGAGLRVVYPSPSVFCLRRERYHRRSVVAAEQLLTRGGGRALQKVSRHRLG